MTTKKTFYFDVETTGLNPYKNDIVQLAAVIEENGEIKDKLNLNMRPFDMTTVESGALKVIGKTKEDIDKYPDPRQTYLDLVSILAKYVDKYDRNDKFYIVGYNVRFDVDFLNNYFKKNNDNYYGSWFNWKLVDVMGLAHIGHYVGLIDPPNFKLETLCNLYGIKIDAHDALSDILATRELFQNMKNYLKV